MTFNNSLNSKRKNWNISLRISLKHKSKGIKVKLGETGL